jgi:uncharacterized membrane protein YeiH
MDSHAEFMPCGYVEPDLKWRIFTHALTNASTYFRLEDILFWLTVIAVAVSAMSAVLIAGQHRFDLFGMSVIALATALGGGSLRDMLLNKHVFWIDNQLFLIVALCAGVASFFYARSL